MPNKSPKVYRLEYDAAASTPRRKVVSGSLQSEDAALPAHKRRQVVLSSRDLQQNFSIAAWALRRHLDYVATFSFQSRTGIVELDRRIEELVAWWSRPRNCDIAGRHGFHRMIRLLEARRMIDGDVFVLKLGGENPGDFNRGRLQAIEGDRVRNPYGSAGGVDLADFDHGVRTNDAGRALAYLICKRGSYGNAFVLDRVVAARNIVSLGCYTRFDQTRGITPFVTALNSFRDVYEASDFALAKAKVSQLLGFTFHSDQPEPLGEVTEVEATEYEVDFGKGVWSLNMGKDDTVQVHESKVPSVEFQDFMRVTIMAALKSVDIPYSFYDEAHTNYSGSRGALLQYEQSAAEKRRDIQDLLNQLLGWRLSLWIKDGVLVLPGTMTLHDLVSEWIPAGLPWLDPLKEVEADIRAVKNKLNSRTRILKRQGLDFFTVADELAAEEEYLAAKQPIQTPDEEEEE